MTVEFLDMTCPSDALTEMVNGLMIFPRRKSFAVDMGTYGQVRGEVCFGCAATATLLSASGTNPTYHVGLGILQSDRVIAYGLDPYTEDYANVRDFEAAVDLARIGRLFRLFRFFGVEGEHLSEIHDDRFQLSNNDWHEQLPLVQDLIDELEEEGL